MTEQVNTKACLVLSDGFCLKGSPFGANGLEAEGEVVFSTAMTGYPELMTDPSFYGQILCLTVAEVGTYGVCLQDLESNDIQIKGLIVNSYSFAPENHRSDISLDVFLKNANIPAICNVDTRTLVQHLRTKGSKMGVLSTDAGTDINSLHAKASQLSHLNDVPLFRKVSTNAQYEFSEGLRDWQSNLVPVKRKPNLHVVAYDFGIKKNILRLLVHHGCRVTVVPHNTPASKCFELAPDGVFLSNGPGDPGLADLEAEIVAGLLGKVPMFGICLGYQIMQKARGQGTKKLLFGHRGANQPVIGEDKKIYLTAQNHGYEVEGCEGPGIYNLSDGTSEGVFFEKDHAFGVQYHPEGAPGPHDTQYHFEQFIKMMKEWKKQI